MKFQECNLKPELLRAIEEVGYEQMTPIQEQAIPAMLEGGDLIGQAQTGTGKTAAFGIPLIEKINPEEKGLQAIVLCPTRELAIQTAEEMRKLTKYTRNPHSAHLWRPGYIDSDSFPSWRGANYRRYTRSCHGSYA